MQRAKNKVSQTNRVSMYPNPKTYTVKEKTTLRKFIATLGEHILYAYDRRVVGVSVNHKKLWDSAKLEPGDKVIVYPIIAGG